MRMEDTQMKKRLLAILLAAALLAVFIQPVAAAAAAMAPSARNVTETIGGIEYELNKEAKTATVTGGSPTRTGSW